MTSNIYGVLNTGRVSLLTQQAAIEVTGQNIANVQTEGYTRQKLSLQANTPRSFGALGSMGTGVRVAGIERAHDQFIFTQIVEENSSLGKFDIKKNIFDQMEILFDNSFGGGLNERFSDFFASLHDLSNNPRGLAERADVLAKSQLVAEEFNRIGENLFQERVNADQIIGSETIEINDLLSQIAQLNKAIHGNEVDADFGANDLRDLRDNLIKELGEKIDVNSVEDANNLVTVTLGDGTPLVLGITPLSLSTSLDGNNQGFKDINVVDINGNTKNITSRILGGKVRGLLDMRDTELVNAMDKMDRLAAAFVQEFNRIHKEGVGSDGTTGIDFFSTLTPTITANTNNSGTAILAASNASPTTNSVDKYEILVTGSNTFTLNNLTTGQASGTFTFTPGSALNLIGGLSVTFSGTAAVGDQFKISVSENASRLISASNIVQSNLQKIAAGKTSNGDGNNAQELAGLQNRLVFNGTCLQSGSGSFTFDDFYNSIVTTVAVNANSAQVSLNQQEGLKLQLINRRESASGVSIDEEMISLIKFQQAFNAAARVINTVDEMLTILQNQT